MANTLTVGQLIHQLQTLDLDAPVRLAVQPDWPFSHFVGSIAEDRLDPERTVYIGEAGQEDYLPPSVRLLLGWMPK